MMINFSKQYRHVKNNESGIVSLIVVSILAVVIGLISVGFSQLANRELRQATDRELSAQAYYSAEAGLYDARAYLEAGGTSLSGCDDWKNNPLGPQYFATDLSTTAKYSCVIINTQPRDLLVPLHAGQTKIEKVTQDTLGRLFLAWETQGQNDSGATLGTLGNLPQESNPIFTNPAATGVLRVSIYPVNRSASSATNGTLNTASRTYFLYPNSGSGAPGCVTYSGATCGSGAIKNGGFVPGNCNTVHSGLPTPVNEQYFCNSVITGLDGTANTYYVKLTAEYTDMNVLVQATSSSSNKALTFLGIQGLIDITGRGTDVLQRISARVDIDRQYQQPGYSLQSMVALCKGFTAEITAPNQYGDTGLAGGFPNNDGACIVPDGGGSIGNGSGETGPH